MRKESRPYFSAALERLIREGKVLLKNRELRLSGLAKYAEIVTFTEPQKIDRDPVSCEGIGDQDYIWCHESGKIPLSLLRDDFFGRPIQCQENHTVLRDQDQDQELRNALELLIAELPALLEDREKLRKLREELG